MGGELLIFDTSVFIDHLRTGCHQERIDSLRGLIRTSSVVFAELLRGATRPAERAFLSRLQKLHPLLTPSESNWIESGGILAKMRAQHGYSAEKMRDLHFDVLIALTARSYGARLISSNRADFELIKAYRHFNLEVW